MSQATQTDEIPAAKLFDANPSDPENPPEDHDGPVAGWTREGRSNDRFAVPTALDFVPLDSWTHRGGLPCVLLAVTRYFIRGYATRDRDEWEYEEEETNYVGMVYCPQVETPYGAYSGIRTVRKGDSDWFQTGAADDLKKPGIGVDTLAEAVRSKTNTLARGLRGHAEESVCECGWKPTNSKRGHDDGCPAENDAAWLPDGPEGFEW